jgi:Carboxypeptidase regulatory-like domain
MHRSRTAFLVFALAAVCALVAGSVSAPSVSAQATVGTGSIQGTVLDPNGATVLIAKVTLASKDSGRQASLEVTGAGQFNSGPITPGNYVVRVEANGFKTVERQFAVQIGQITSANFALELGSSSTVITVETSTVQVNTDQASVQGVLTQEQIENLPINGRNFLDLAQLEPGVQIQDGNNFDPTKVGFSSISFGGRFGRTARIEVDGVDISDETVGTTTSGVPASALQEFQVSQSSLDLSQELTSSGGVNLTTRSGTNSVHGEGFGYFRDSSMAAALPGPPSPFQRSQFGGNIGGPIVKNKAFFFLDAERTKQDLQAPVPISSDDPLTSFSGGFSSPFRETNLLARADYNFGNKVKLFYKYSYFQNLAISTFGAISFQPFQDKNYTRTHTVGADFSTGAFSHSIRFEYLKFQNNLSDAVIGTGLPFADFPLSLNIGNSFATGPNLLAPQTTPQSDHQLKYDGSRTWGSHIIRFGIAYNHLRGGGFAKFFSLTPSVFDPESSDDVAFANAQSFVCPGGQTGAACPYNYPLDFAFIGNGLGFSTENKAFGFPLGGLGPDNRLGVYLGDSWKIKPNLTLTYGLRWVRDTGRTDSDLDTIQVLNSFLPGVGGKVQQPNGNLAPQAGIAWDPGKNGKTVIRAGAGLYYENVIWNNVLFDRPGRLANGGFLSFPPACSGGSALPVPFANGSNQPVLQSAPVGACGDAGGNLVPIGDGSPGTAAALLAGFQQQFQAAAAAAGGSAPNPNFIPNLIAEGGAVPLGTFAPAYKTPRSVQMNIGIERELKPGLKISADYVRNVGLHYLLSVNANHTGDAAFLNLPAAQATISSTLANCGVGSINQSLVSCPFDPATGTTDGGTWVPRAATIFDFAGNGLDSPDDLFGGGACMANGGFQCAFGGINPNIGAVPLLYPIGRSVYNALDVKFTGNMNHPLRGIKHANFQVSYTYSKFTNSGGSSPTSPGASDQDFVISAVDFRDPNGFSGPSTLDRPNQLNFGGYFDLPLNFRLGFVSHFWSALPTSIQVPSSAGGSSNTTGEIFLSDFTGDGTVGDLMPGTTVGNFGRGISINGLNSLINNFNSTIATNVTPAGQALIDAGLFTQAQLMALGAHPTPLTPAPADQADMRGMRAFDLTLAWEGKIHERFTISPSVGFYNLFNFANFDLPGNALSGSLTASAGSINGTSNATRPDRVGVGTGVFALGSPRVIEFGLKFTF